MRWFVAAFFVLMSGTLTLLVSGTAWAAAPAVRTSATPSLQGGVRLHPKVGLAARVQGRFKLGGSALGDRTGIAFSPGVRFFPHPIVGVSLHYALGVGDFPLEGAGYLEHSAVPAIQLGGGDRFVVSNTTRIELRNLWIRGFGHEFSLRPRNALRLTAVVRPWFKASLDNEALVSPRDGLGRSLQLRSGLALHGDVALGRPRGDTERPPPTLFWLTGATVGLTPVALARGAAPEPSDRRAAQAADQASTIDVVITAGLGAFF